MKNHIIVKFIAILLCAASLLSLVGCGLGIFALTEMDLYDKTVEQVYAEQLELNGRNLAHKIGMRYASTTLGGSPEVMLDYFFGSSDTITSSGFDPDHVGYVLKDAEGNVLQSRDLPSGDAYTTHTFEVTGQYMHFVDSVTVSEQATQNAAQIAEEHAMADGSVQFDAIPDEGAKVYEVQISTENSSVGFAGDGSDFVFRNHLGQVILRCPGTFLDPIEQNTPVTQITLVGESGVLYQAENPEGVGLLQFDENGSMMFLSFPADDTAEAAPAEAAEETVPVATGPVEKTVPAETMAEETAPAEDATEATTGETTEETTDSTETTEETTAEETEAQETTEETAPAETAAEADSEEADLADSESEAVAAKEDSEAEPVEGNTEATEETVAPTVPETVPEETVPEETVPPETIPEPVMINGRALNTYQINRTEYHDDATGEWTTARYVYITMPEMTLELYVTPGALRSDASYALMGMVRSVRGYLLPVMGIGLLILAVCVLYLCCAAGRKPNSDEIRPGGLNRIPLDLYGIAALSGIVSVGIAVSEYGAYLLDKDILVGCAFMAGLGYLAALLAVGFFFACAAQFKTPGHFWWHYSLCGLLVKLGLWLLKKSWKLCIRLKEWAAAKGCPMLKRLLIRIWTLLCRIWQWLCSSIQKSCLWVRNQIHRFLSLLPTIWQWLLAGFLMILFLFITVAGRFDTGIVLSILFAFGLILYGAYCFGILMETTRKMNKGDLDSKVDDRLMVGSFKEFASDLNDLAGVAIISAQKQLKSERMKTELITNVSHDIKTPLTSLINYVDLLQKPHTEEEQEQYLEVLDRQSLRLKKLIDDLIDMSKASTGNMPVDITLVDAVESVNQALGEFADKLDRAQLVPVFRHTEDTVAMMADGKLVWRVLSNLLSNAVKYAMPGTRLYIDLMTLDNKVVISLKNISRDELNVDAEELMERFVRGDDSRNTEGSGLGLNIAKSLMELQKGQLQMLVDGDLFKVTLIFPGI